MPNQMTEEIQRRREKLFKFGLHVQPFVVVVGEVEAPAAAYVVVDSTTWKVTSVQNAVDVCFKAFQALNANPYVAAASEVSVWHHNKMGCEVDSS